MDTGNTTGQPGRDPSKDTGFFLGELSGKVANLGEKVVEINTKFEKQEEAQEKRHETQRREQRDTNQTLFEKLDKIAESAHATPCPKLSQNCQAVDAIGTRIGPEGDIGKLPGKVSNMKTAGTFTWRTAMAAAGIFAFILTVAISILALIF